MISCLQAFETQVPSSRFPEAIAPMHSTVMIVLLRSLQTPVDLTVHLIFVSEFVDE